MPAATDGKPTNICIDNLSHHYVINSAGAVLNPIDICQPGNFMPKSTCRNEDLNKCSIGIKYNGSLTDPRLRPLLIDLLLYVSIRFPEVKILAKNEFDPRHIKVRNDMNGIRRELSEYL